MSKRVLILLLGMLNVGLLACLVARVAPGSVVWAQDQDQEQEEEALLEQDLQQEAIPPADQSEPSRQPGKVGDMLVISAQADAGNDVIYVFDKNNMMLHAFRTPFPRASGQAVGIAQVDARDLRADFGNVRRGGAR